MMIMWTRTYQCDSSPSSPSSNESVTQDTSHFETTDPAMLSWVKHADIRLRGPPRPDPNNCIDMIQPVIFEKKQKGEFKRSGGGSHGGDTYSGRRSSGSRAWEE